MIIGITGTNGAGKGTVVEYLVGQKGFTHYSVRDFLGEELTRRGLPINRDTLPTMGTELRTKFGAGYITEQLFDQASKNGNNGVIESIRSLGEAEFLKSHGALLWAVDADRELRYERIVKRGSGTDKVSFEEFCIQEDRELSTNDKFDMDVLGVMAMADHTFYSNAGKDELYVAVEEALQELQSKK